MSIELLNIDCMDYMAKCKDKEFDLAVVDPQTGQGEGKRHATRPYNCVQKNGARLNIKRRHAIKEWDCAAPEQKYYDELFRVSKHQIIMCENQISFSQKDSSAGRIVWNLLRDNDFSACNIMWTSLTNKIDYFEYMWSGMMQGDGINSRRQIGDKSLNQNRIHPSEKPIIVYKYLLKKYAQSDWKILDTHGGSFAIGIAAHALNISCTATEIDKDYFESAMKRYKRVTSQTALNFNKVA